MTAVVSGGRARHLRGLPAFLAGWIAFGLVALAPGPARAQSVSCGAANHGALAGGVAIPAAGPGFVTPTPWRRRGMRYGTLEIVRLVERAARQVARLRPGAVLAVADLSAPGGGLLPHHQSHQSGRDVDLVYYALGPHGRPFAPDNHMAYYGATGRATWSRAPHFTPHIRERFFDLASNWDLVAALVGDPVARVTHIYVSRQVRRWLVNYGKSIGAPAALLMRVEQILDISHGPAHNDHMHVRIACSEDDIAAGSCTDQPDPRPRRLLRPVRCLPPGTTQASTPLEIRAF